ncbi:glycerol-3-phosphate dehydrogenase [Flindersiella endophytica]
MVVDRSRLAPDRRDDLLRTLRGRHFDVLVIGGGVTGCGAALDAASRGLAVALIEANDLASGTSSRSGKIFHGGLRYLEQFNLSLVREALLERDLMVERLCPHLVSPETFLFPFTKHWQRPYIGAGVAIYDLLRLTGPRSVPGHRHLSRKAVLRAMPGLSPEHVTGGVQYSDVRVDDARHTMSVARTAAGLGATVLARARAVGLLREAGRVTGARVRDVESGDEFDVTAQVVVNASGVWADQVQKLSGTHSISVTPAKGVHLVVPRDRIESSTGLIARTPDSVFIVRRWFDYWLMGTTDTRWEYDRDDPAATKDDVDYLLGHANRWLRKPLDYPDLVGVYAGLRPLVGVAGGSTASLRRDHTVLEDPIGLITIVGGKYTTYRLMARDVIDAATSRLRRTVPPSATDQLPIHGAVRFGEYQAGRAELASESGLAEDRIDHLLGRYGTATSDLLDLVASRPLLGRPVEGAPGYLGAEIVYAAQAEGALHLDDVLTRRTHISMETSDRGVLAAPMVADLMAEALGWDDSTREEEVERYRLAVEADRVAAASPTDSAASAARKALLEPQPGQ